MAMYGIKGVTLVALGFVWSVMQKLLKEGELLKFARKERQPRMFFLVGERVNTVYLILNMP